MKIVIMGPQGSGKSTQAKLLAGYLGLPHLSTGDFFRNLQEKNSEFARRVGDQLKKGRFVSDSGVIAVLKDELSKQRFKEGFILDGYPRNLWQAENSPFEPDLVFYLRVGDGENTIRLLKRGREDDTEELIRKRLSDYHKLTEPVLDFYRAKGVLEEVDGERLIEEIYADIQSRIGE